MKTSSIPAEPQEIRFGTFGGVFTPSVLTIIGVILYLRTGWVVGQSGLIGALVIVALAHSVTIATGLSLSSICTNIRLGSGGAYSIIAKSLGLEVGGAIGIPLYVSQAVSTAFYIAGFTEAWMALANALHLPIHHPLLVSITTWAALSIISYIGAEWALKVQYFIMAAIAVSIASFFFGPSLPGAGVESWTIAGYKDFFRIFSIFFPAVTGILAGVSMSGDLKNAKRSIPIGTMLAIFVGMVVYGAATWRFGKLAGAKDLLENPTVMIDLSRFGWTFYIGIFAATLSSALGSLVGAPRTLGALGEHGVLPFSRFFAGKDRKGQPRNSVIFTSLFALIFVVFGSLDTIAPLLTIFFLITYGMLNLVTFIESSTGIVSFRPSFKTPSFISLFGATACFFIMIVIDPIVSFIAGAIIVGIYATLMRVGMKARWGDVRSGMFLSIATWAARQASHLPKTPKSWTPNLLVPLEEPRESPLIVQFARDLCYPGGSVIAYSVANADKAEREKELEDALQAIREDKIFCISAAIDNRDFALTSKTLIQFLRNIFLRPNILFITLGDDPSKDAQIKAIIDSAIEQEMGLAILKINPKSGFNLRKDVNLALRDRSPNIDLAILLALQLSKNWDRSRIHLVALSRNEAESVSQANFFAALKEDARMPSNTEIRTVEGQYPEDLARWPRCDIAIFGIGHEVSLEQMRQVASIGGFSCLFVRDSGEESAFD